MKFIDIETVPNFDIATKVDNLEIKVPANYKKQDTIDSYCEGKKQEMYESMVKSASLSPVYGRIASIAIGDNDGINCLVSKDESELVDFLCDRIGDRPNIVTFNGKAFDLPFIQVRAGVLKKKLPFINAHHSKYDQSMHFDMYLYLTNFQGFGKSGVLSHGQKAVADHIGLDGMDFDGSQVYPAWMFGEFDKIEQYNKKDVEQLMAICEYYGVTHG